MRQDGNLSTAMRIMGNQVAQEGHHIWLKIRHASIRILQILFPQIVQPLRAVSGAIPTLRPAKPSGLRRLPGIFAHLLAAASHISRTLWKCGCNSGDGSAFAYWRAGTPGTVAQGFKQFLIGALIDRECFKERTFQIEFRRVRRRRSSRFHNALVSLEPCTFCRYRSVDRSGLSLRCAQSTGNLARHAVPQRLRACLY